MDESELMFEIGDIVNFKGSNRYALVISVDRKDFITILWFHNGKTTPFYILDSLIKVN
jgi:hypothetical protein